MAAQEPPLYLIYRSGYQGIYPPFHNPSEFEWTSTVEQNWRVIHDELFANPELKAMSASHVKGEGGWKGLYLVNFCWMKHKNIKKFPETMGILNNSVPHLTFAAFSILEPGLLCCPIMATRTPSFAACWALKCRHLHRCAHCRLAVK